VKLCADATVDEKTKVAQSTWKYTAEATDTGTFTTDGVKSFKGATMKPGVTGTFSGGFTATLTGPANFSGLKTTGTNTNTKSSSEWLGWIFPGSKSELTTWGWTYKTCNETLSNTFKGNTGDITGLAKNLGSCLKVTWTDKCDTLVVTVANTAPSDAVKAYVVVKFHDDVKAEVKGGQSVTLIVPKPDAKHPTVLLVGGERNPLTHQWKTTGCTTATPTVTATTPGVPVTTTTAGTSLPVTGPKTALIIGTGLVLLFGGAALVWVARRRRDRVTFEA
jgi:hypothetical protein